VVLKPETVVPKAVAVLCTVVRVLLMELKLLARFVMLLIAIGRVAYCDPPVLFAHRSQNRIRNLGWWFCRTAETVNAVVLGGLAKFLSIGPCIAAAIDNLIVGAGEAVVVATKRTGGAPL